jgi:hypothetical protein
MAMASHFRAISTEALAELLAQPEHIHRALAEPASADTHLELTRVWHGLHFLLSGVPWCGAPPLDFILNGGAPVGEEDVGHGPARGFSADEVTAIADALATQSWPELWTRWDPELVRALSLYGIDPDAPEGEPLKTGLDSLTAFIQAVAERRQAMLVYVL